MPSFDIVSEINKQEIRNAIDQVNKEVTTRFDFKGSDTRIEQIDYKITIHTDNEFKLDQVFGIIVAKFTKRNIDTRCLDKSSVEKTGGDRVKQLITTKVGIEAELAKKIVRLVKDSGLKVQASIQGESVRISSLKRDTLQEAIQLIKKSITEFPVQFQNFRD
ncbi:MAG: YajQ family cyclic di-GMP-binding protein [Nitrosospira sp.]|nr:YajQ family cyclic di-GMP-binding protein [Nitrosospira sp.]MDW7643199.1 YajQ family cyclic di-GMP-binding protein [Nitrosomonadaceae bacterium]MBI0416712.1 YajQ family cyclic di-GMP-binding protein [Nitrosospira sp.]MBI0418343.1 YajQ family cyclic di-GMP-binding protein [Nitrosospira sp.]MBI0419633.1 YajQ family cyclic di-GMP-binding protein [Nitrosospira sp.]